MQEILLTNAIAVGGLMLMVWLLSLPLKNASIVDIAWGLGFVLIAWVTASTTTSAGAGRWLLIGLTTVWGCRLGAYLAWRNVGQSEDWRYAEMRDKWGQAFPLVSVVTVFLLQGIVMWTVSLPVQLGIGQSQPGWTVLQIVGVLPWVVGLLFETVGDWQLARFKANPENEGKVFDQGLWRFTRHPNYFGDFCVWWGLYLIALGSGAPWWTIVGPVVMSIFLMRISGVTLLRTITPRPQAGICRVRRHDECILSLVPPNGQVRRSVDCLQSDGSATNRNKSSPLQKPGTPLAPNSPVMGEIGIFESFRRCGFVVSRWLMVG